jgi:hypothetical protein
MTNCVEDYRTAKSFAIGINKKFLKIPILILLGRIAAKKRISSFFTPHIANHFDFALGQHESGAVLAIDTQTLSPTANRSNAASDFSACFAGVRVLIHCNHPLNLIE